MCVEGLRVCSMYAGLVLLRPLCVRGSAHAYTVGRGVRAAAGVRGGGGPGGGGPGNDGRLQIPKRRRNGWLMHSFSSRLEPACVV